MNKIALEVKKKLEALSCPVHNSHPIVIINGEGWSVKCCDDLLETCQKEEKKIVLKFSRNALNGLFKK